MVLYKYYNIFGGRWISLKLDGWNIDKVVKVVWVIGDFWW